MHAVDDQYFFVGYDIHSEPELGTNPFPTSEFPDIRVYRMKDRSFVGLIEPQKEVYHGTHGALDIGQCSFCLEKLDDGRYFLAIEDYCGGKNVYYLWRP